MNLDSLVNSSFFIGLFERLCSSVKRSFNPHSECLSVSARGMGEGRRILLGGGHGVTNPVPTEAQLLGKRS